MPWLVAMKGFAGSGKSTLARALGRELGWAVLDKDDVMDVLHGRAPEAGRLAYEVLLRVTRRQLLQGLSVICDSPLAFRSLYEHAGRIADESGARLAVVECVCPDEGEWRRRIDGRKALGLPDHHQTDWAAFVAYRDSREEHAYAATAPRLVVDTTRPLPENLAEVVGWLERQDTDRGRTGQTAAP